MCEIKIFEFKFLIFVIIFACFTIHILLSPFSVQLFWNIIFKINTSNIPQCIFMKFSFIQYITIFIPFFLIFILLHNQMFVFITEARFCFLA